MGVKEAVLDEAGQLAYEREGWVCVPGFFSGAEVAMLDRYIEEIRELPERSRAQMIYRETSRVDQQDRILQRIEDFCPHHARMDALIRFHRLQHTVEHLLGGSAVLFKDKINFKMPGGAGFEPHQD